MALENSEQFLNDKSLFGSLKIDGNLTKEGNTIFGATGGSDAKRTKEETIFCWTSNLHGWAIVW